MMGEPAVGGGRHQKVKDGAHPFKLGGNAASLLLVGVCEHNEVLGAHFKPVIHLSPGRRQTESLQEETARQWFDA